jgi:integrase
MFLARTGRRISEVVRNDEYGSGVKGKDINWEEGMIEFTILKKSPRKRRDDGTLTERRERIRKLKPVPKQLLIELKKYIDNYDLKDSDYLFDFTTRRARQIIVAIGKKVGIEKVGNKQIHPHHFRHSFIVEGAKRVKNAQDLRLLQNMAEHSTINMTAEYMQFAPELERDLLKRMFIKNENKNIEDANPANKEEDVLGENQQ